MFSTVTMEPSSLMDKQEVGKPTP